jgi:hypothetical protein
MYIVEIIDDGLEQLKSQKKMENDHDKKEMDDPKSKGMSPIEAMVSRLA